MVAEVDINALVLGISLINIKEQTQKQKTNITIPGGKADVYIRLVIHR